MIFNQYILPRRNSRSGQIEVRINVNNNDFDSSNALILASEMNTFLTMGPIKRAMNDEEGFITSDQIEIELLDSLTVEGRIPDHDNPNLLYSETPIEGSLLNKIFGDKTAKYTVFVSVYKPYPGTAEFTDVETIFIGDVDPNSIPKDHFWISDAETEKEVTMQAARITVNAGSSRLKSFTVKEFINGVQYSTVTVPPIDAVNDNLVNGKFYSGFIYDRRADYLFQTPPETSWDKYVTGANPPTSPDIPASPPQYRWGNGWVQISTSNRYDDMILEPFPKGLNAINFGTILKRIAKICGFTFSELSDLTSAFKFAQPQWLGFYVVPNTAYTHPKDLTLIYQYAFGINPADGITEYANSSGYSWSTSLSEIVKDIALQLGAHIYTEVSNPGNGQPPSLRLRILSRRTEKGTKPNNWQIKQNGSKEQPRKINKTSVEVKNGASEGSMFCPVQSKETIQITQKWRVRKWGNLTPDNIFTTDNFNHDIKKLPVEQDSHLRIKDSGKPNKLGDSAWVLGTYLYAPALELGGTTLNRAYPDNWGIPLDGNSFNAIMWVLDKETKVELRMNTQYSASQLFAQELVNNPLVLERTYIGVADDNRMISTIQPGMETSFRFIGQMTTFRAFEIEQDIIKNETKVKWYSKPEDYSALADLPIVLQGEAGAVTGGSSNTANSAGIQTQDIGSTFLVPVIREIPNGVINGINTSFSISQVPKLNTEQIYLNGVLLEPGNEEDYTMSGATINFNYAPLIGDRIRVSFIK